MGVGLAIEDTEAVEVIVEVVVDDDVVATLGRDEVTVLIAVAVGARGTMFFVIAAMVLLLSGITLTVIVVDAGTQILVVEAIAEVGLIDLLIAGAGASRLVSTRLRLIARVLYSHTLSLS